MGELKKGDKVRMIGGKQSGTKIGGIYDVSAAHGDSWLKYDGTDYDGHLCDGNEFFLIDEDGDHRYQKYPSDFLTEWEKVDV